MSMPGTAEQKRPLIECMSCHTFERIVRSTYDAESFVPVLKRMAQYANNTTQARVQSRVAERDVNDDSVRKLAAYLATVNLSRGAAAWDYELQTLPRPKGRATHVVITEYDMPRKTIAPHDVRTDRDGHVWYSDFVENFLGELDPDDRRAQGISDSGAKPDFPNRHARSRSRCRRQSVARFDVSDRARPLRHGEQDLSDLSAAGSPQRRRHAAIHGDAARDRVPTAKSGPTTWRGSRSCGSI